MTLHTRFLTGPELCSCGACGQEAEVTDPAEAVWQHMEQEAADELAHVERHHFGPRRLTVILPAEPNLSVAEIDQPAVGDSDPMRVAPQIVEHVLRIGKRTLGID